MGSETQADPVVATATAVAEQPETQQSEEKNQWDAQEQARLDRLDSLITRLESRLSEQESLNPNPINPTPSLSSPPEPITELGTVSQSESAPKLIIESAPIKEKKSRKKPERKRRFGLKRKR